jgi:hypothetical protein
LLIRIIIFVSSRKERARALEWPRNPRRSYRAEQETAVSDDVLRIVLGGVLLVHGIAHLGALGALWWAASGRDAGGWKPARMWAAPSLTPRTATQAAVAFWIVSAVGFVLTALAFWGLVLPVAWWQPLGVLSALVSGTGIILFIGTWPAFNTVAAMAVNIGVLVAVVIGWPPASVYLP